MDEFLLRFLEARNVVHPVRYRAPIADSVAELSAQAAFPCFVIARGLQSAPLRAAEG
jgi:hypothetical protein